MKKEDEKSLEDYINQFKKDERDRIIKILKEMMPQLCEGWQDAIKFALKKIGELK